MRRLQDWVSSGWVVGALGSSDGHGRQVRGSMVMRSGIGRIDGGKR